ncbi:MAG TPA: GGDEF domain-containing phosphodiesterase, partial [Mariprofundaceae bacterium]|nr:GGDEF domain-containing phosphodiesterase [Mariprofundaceae bacterium]
RSEFAIVLANMPLSDAERLSNYLASILEHPFGYEGVPLNVDSTIGYLSLSENGDKDASQLLQMSELAVMNARQAHRKVAVVHDPDHHRINRDNLALLGQLRSAVKEGDLLLHYQPKLSLVTEEVVGAEALMRWQHPERGMIPPDQFIPQAEQSSIINELTTWALNSALSQHAEWRREGQHVGLQVAVNVSASDLMASDFPGIVLGALDRHGVDYSNLELEVTESVLMEDIDRSISVLNWLSSASVIISIDDFGTGYSSLKYLDMLPATALKIDKSFTLRLLSDKRSRHITEAAIGLAHSLGMRVIAEGVENIETFSMLREMGCDIGQGYFISRPLPHDEFSGFSFQGA